MIPTERAECFLSPLPFPSFPSQILLFSDLYCVHNALRPLLLTSFPSVLSCPVDSSALRRAPPLVISVCRGV